MNSLVEITTRPGHYTGIEKPAKCKTPTIKRRYVEILAMCAIKPKTRNEIYGSGNSIPHQLYALESGGFLKRYTKPEWAERCDWPKTWWKTTSKGMEVIAKAMMDMLKRD